MGLDHGQSSFTVGMHHDLQCSADLIFVVSKQFGIWVLRVSGGKSALYRNSKVSLWRWPCASTQGAEPSSYLLTEEMDFVGSELGMGCWMMEGLILSLGGGG